MHPFMLIGGVLHLTVVAIIAFFNWFAASKSSGLLKTFGNLLGAWLVLLGIVSIVMAATGMGPRHKHGWMMHEGDGGPAASTAATPANAAAS